MLERKSKRPSGSTEQLPMMEVYTLRNPRHLLALSVFLADKKALSLADKKELTLMAFINAHYKISSSLHPSLSFPCNSFFQRSLQ